MTKSEVHQNIDYLKSIAEQGINSPLLGGRIGLMWTVLLVPTLLIHGAAATGKLEISENAIGAIWMVFGIVGGVLTYILSRGLDAKDGAGSIGNRIESIIWPVQALLIFAYAIGAVFAVSIFNLPPESINTLMPFAFGLTSVNLILLGRITQQGYLFYAGVASAIFMFISISFVNHGEIYFVAALGVFITGVIPNLMQLRKESK